MLLGEAQGGPMMTATAPRLEVCPEYQLLLQHCQQTLATWQQRYTIATRSPLAAKRATAELQQLQSNYALACSRLESHEKSCQTCQYISKIAGLDFESMSDALYRRSG
jgi:lipid II:glycine glycyltransferase (peptidoglycan interpeptide bridge formation enzyme)